MNKKDKKREPVKVSEAVTAVVGYSGVRGIIKLAYDHRKK